MQRLGIILMDISIFILAITFILVISSPSSSATLFDTLTQGSSLSTEKSDEVLISPNGVFSAGLYPVGFNAFYFAVWFANSSDRTVVWMANRNVPVNGRGSKLSVLRSGNLILTDAGRSPVWTSDTASASSVQLRLLNTGNLVLRTLKGATVWQSFDSPTDTLLPGQPLTRNTQLISSRSRGNYSSGNYKFYFENNNVLRLLYDGMDISSLYWHLPWLLASQAGRDTFNNSRTAVLNSAGFFKSSDNFDFSSSDFGIGPQRRLTLDFDGNLRLYSLVENTSSWVVSWQVISQPCTIHGVCGPNSLCSYNPEIGRQCSCMAGYKMRNHTDWSYGCEPEFTRSCNLTQFGFIGIPHVEFYGYDFADLAGYTFRMCQNACLNLCNCVGFQYNFDSDNDVHRCYPKFLLLNGHHSPSFGGFLYLKLPKTMLSNSIDGPVQEFKLECTPGASVQLDRTYEKRKENGSLKFLVVFAAALGTVELICIFLVWCCLFRNHKDNASLKEYLLAATGFKTFTYAELRKATKGFSEEIGRGGGGIVYKGVLSDQRATAIKRLYEAYQGEAEFLAEVSTIGKLNHMNLIEMWGYCAEGKHRILVYEFMERGTLADNLNSEALNWKKRFEIAVGTAKGLAYLHEECLEWILHCDIKPQNILLDSDYNPKVADFGLSKLLKIGDLKHESFSRIRGTRGYMAPEWVFNQPITSKVDVYSYGIVVLEMVTGKSPTGIHSVDGGGMADQGRLVTWVRDRMNAGETKESWIEDIVDPILGGKYDVDKMDVLVKVALKCVEEDKDARSTNHEASGRDAFES